MLKSYKHVLVMYLIISWFVLLRKCRNYSGIVPEPKLKNWKCFFQAHLGRDSPYGFSFSVLVRELFRNICGKIEKLKLFFPGTFRKRFSIWIQFFSFGSGTLPEYLRKNWETVKLKNCFFQGHSGRDSPYGFNFSVLLHHRAGTIV